MISAWLASYCLELRLGVRSRRFLVFMLLFLVPVALAMALRAFVPERLLAIDQRRFLIYINFLFLMLAVPLASLVHGARLVRDDVEQGTWPYHLLTPLHAWQTLLAQYAAAITVVLALSLPALLAAAVALLAGGEEGLGDCLELIGRAAVGITAAACAYTAVFAAFGVLLRRPLVAGVIYGLISEYALQLLPGDTVVRDFTVIHHVRSILVTAELRVYIEENPLRHPGFLLLEDTPRALLSLAAFTAVCLAVAAVAVSRRQFAADRAE